MILTRYELTDRSYFLNLLIFKLLSSLSFSSSAYLLAIHLLWRSSHLNLQSALFCFKLCCLLPNYWILNALSIFWIHVFDMQVFFSPAYGFSFHSPREDKILDLSDIGIPPLRRFSSVTFIGQKLFGHFCNANKV